jgi:hypothetical protein
VSPLLQSVGYATIKNQSKQDALLPLKCVGYATVKNQSKPDALLPLNHNQTNWLQVLT